MIDINFYLPVGLGIAFIIAAAINIIMTKKGVDYDD